MVRWRIRNGTEERPFGIDRHGGDDLTGRHVWIATLRIERDGQLLATGTLRFHAPLKEDLPGANDEEKSNVLRDALRKHLTVWRLKNEFDLIAVADDSGIHIADN